jgi:biopolymer transport protein ExbB
MNLTEKFLQFALLGAEWVMWLLVVLSIVSVAVMIERLKFYRTRSVDLGRLMDDLRRLLGKHDLEGAKARLERTSGMEAEVALGGLQELPRGHGAVEEAMTGAKVRERIKLESNIAFLGTLGNNAPFIGLFGTVLGIIRAFNKLAKTAQPNPRTVMFEISEALVATAIGLLVAIPAVVAFNYFRGRIKRTMANADALSHVVLAYAKAEETPSKPAAVAASGGASNSLPSAAAERAKESEPAREKSA